jgi:hypothetical protein
LGRLTIFTAVSIPLVLAVSIVLAIETEFSPPVFNTKVIPTWEDEIPNGYLPYHQLTADDFPVKDNLAPEAAYWVQPFVHNYYNCISKMAMGGMIYAYVKDWTVFSGLNKNLSGRKSKFRLTKDELAYAQAILDINELYARRLAALQPGEFPSGSGRTWAEAQRQLENRVETLCQIQMTEMRKEGETLAKATRQGQNKKRVRELADAIKKRLAQLPPANGPSPTATPATVSPPIFIPPPATLTPPH